MIGLDKSRIHGCSKPYVPIDSSIPFLRKRIFGKEKTVSEKKKTIVPIDSSICLLQEKIFGEEIEFRR
ncbi:hypothetical protein HYC85_000179 [Camellia sinensis]|uniref:Uncharacterized protein n=1 Tax=Camellia sinensis TaxID=4442 RepID=A0A7J7I1N8_CAMSI|nr:hypothetical protein HYC85_000179 [Camellia sinensis]